MGADQIVQGDFPAVGLVDADAGIGSAVRQLVTDAGLPGGRVGDVLEELAWGSDAVLVVAGGGFGCFAGLLLRIVPEAFHPGDPFGQAGQCFGVGLEEFLLLPEQGVLFLECLGQVGYQGDVVHGVEVDGTVVTHQAGQDFKHFLGDEAGVVVGQGRVDGDFLRIVAEGDGPEAADGLEGGGQVEDVVLDAAVGGRPLAGGGDALGEDPAEGLGRGSEDELAGGVGFNVSGAVVAGFVPAGDWGLGVVVDGEGAVEVVGGVDEELVDGHFHGASAEAVGLAQIADFDGAVGPDLDLRLRGKQGNKRNQYYACCVMDGIFHDIFFCA